jgi:3-isopropylmalate/(R)-2-methylmalate dehydratase large subunit
VARDLDRRYRRSQHADHRLERGYDGITDPVSREQVTTLDANIREFGAAAYFPFLDQRQGIVHVMGPEQVPRCPE